jgi:hypothetical protein
MTSGRTNCGTTGLAGQYQRNTKPGHKGWILQCIRETLIHNARISTPLLYFRMTSSCQEKQNHYVLALRYSYIIYIYSYICIYTEPVYRAGYGLDDRGGLSSSPGRFKNLYYSMSSAPALGSGEPPT